MKSFLVTLAASGSRPRELIGCQQPRAKNPPVAIQHVIRPRAPRGMLIGTMIRFCWFRTVAPAASCIRLVVHGSRPSPRRGGCSLAWSFSGMGLGRV